MVSAMSRSSALIVLRGLCSEERLEAMSVGNLGVALSEVLSDFNLEVLVLGRWTILVSGGICAQPAAG